ncbi:MAG TPA: beta-propeller domain-containing protein [Acidimicrobiales bacterium]|nr:beta-propeller domain-containing protein [Acidimicrobiales bacterium]
MNDEPNISPDDDHDPELEEAGSRLRAETRPLQAASIEVGALRRRARRRGVVAAAALVLAVVAVAGAVVTGGSNSDTRHLAGGGGGPEVDRIISSLDAKPVDPTKVHLVSTVKTFPGCDALIGDLRRVGAEHVGSRGFGAEQGMFSTVGKAVASESSDQAMTTGAASLPATGDAAGGETLGTNVQVSGVDELDRVKTEGKWIYDFDGRGNLRITDATSLQVAATIRIIPKASDDDFGPSDSLDSLLEADGKIALFGSRTVTSKPVPGDPSAARSSTSYLTVTFVDATDPAKPHITDRVQVEGALVSARLVDGQVRLVTTSNMDDLGFVLPTTPTSVAKALDRNRRSVASSTAADWIPDWQRTDGSPQPLVPCDRVHVPDTFAGVAMTSMVSFPIATGRFAPEATSIVAPGDTLYAGLDDVAISSHVWVDPIDRQRLKFDDWQTAVHEFSFATDGPPAYEGSGIVDGSTVGQFAFGEVGDALGVVTAKGTPWNSDSDNSVDLVLLTRAGSQQLDTASKLTDLAGGKGTVSAVRFIPGRVLVTTGVDGNLVRVVDVSDPKKPRAAGAVALPGPTGYFHPLGDHRALLVGARTDQVPFGDDTVPRQWVRAQVLDVTDADLPTISDAWEGPWMSDEVAWDHHAFTYWPSRKLAMWGVRWAGFGGDPEPNHAVVLGVDGGVTETALPEALQPPEVPAPCPQIRIDDPEVRQMIGNDAIVLACNDASKRTVEWPRYSCAKIDAEMLRRYAPDQVGKGSVFVCNPAPLPAVQRVLVVDGRPILFTDQTLEALDPQTFASQQVTYHPTGSFGGVPYID